MEGAWKNFGQEEEERVISDLQAFDLYYICRREAEHRHKSEGIFKFWRNFHLQSGHATADEALPSGTKLRANPKNEFHII